MGLNHARRATASLAVGFKSLSTNHGKTTAYFSTGTDRQDMGSLRTHLKQHDHWTFLVGLVLVLVNVRRQDRRLSVLAAGFLLAALGYDCWEVLNDHETP